MALPVPDRGIGQSVLIDVSILLRLVGAMSNKTPANAAPGKNLSPAARRALEEAEARRQAQSAENSKRPKETGGPEGAEPTRYGDWERGGIAYDF